MACDNSSFVILSFTPILIVRSGPVWQLQKGPATAPANYVPHQCQVSETLTPMVQEKVLQYISNLYGSGPPFVSPYLPGF